MVDDGVMVVVMEVDDEEEVGIFDGVDEVVVASMEMKEEEDDLGVALELIVEVEMKRSWRRLWLLVKRSEKRK